MTQPYLVRCRYNGDILVKDTVGGRATLFLLAEDAQDAVVQATACPVFQKMHMQAVHVFNLDDAELPGYLRQKNETAE
jgi:hypothetical protein